MFAHVRVASPFKPVDEDEGVVVGISEDFGIVSDDEEPAINVSVPFVSVDVLCTSPPCEHGFPLSHCVVTQHSEGEGIWSAILVPCAGDVKMEFDRVVDKIFSDCLNRWCWCKSND
jgi:hypothetical protein